MRLLIRDWNRIDELENKLGASSAEPSLMFLSRRRSELSVFNRDGGRQTVGLPRHPRHLVELTEIGEPAPLLAIPDYLEAVTAKSGDRVQLIRCRRVDIDRVHVPQSHIARATTTLPKERR